MQHLRLLCYSDIHHHADYHNGLVEEDIERVESHVTRLAVQHGVHAVCFLGDRFFLRTPPHSTRARADAALKERADHGIPQIILLGNHDRETKNAESSHAFSHIDIFHESLKDVIVMANRTAYLITLKDIEFIIHAVPAGHSIQAKPFEDDVVYSNVVDPIRICMFHDLLAGTFLQNGVKALNGMAPALVDRPAFDLVLGGDNHVPQRLPLTNVKGWYIGAALQHNWGDANQERGYLLINIFKDKNSKLIETEFIPSCGPQFYKVNIAGDDIKDGSDIVKEINTKTDRKPGSIYNIHIILQHGLKIDKEQLEKFLVKQLDARRVTVILEQHVVFKELVPELKTSQSIDQDWSIYVNSGKMDLGGEDPKIIESIGAEILRHA